MACSATPAWVLLLLLTGQGLNAGPLGERLSLSVRAEAGVDFDGFVRLRQFSVEGSQLGLREDLGLRQWTSGGVDFGWRFDDRHALRAGFTGTRFRGLNTLDRDVVHEGATYPAGTQLKLDRSSWWRVEAWYLFTPWRNEHAEIGLLGGVVLDLLDLWVVPNPRPPAPPKDDHENFATAWLPLPALGMRLEVRPLAGLRLGIEARGTHVENLATWHTAGGRMRHSQTSFDGRMEIGYRAAQVEFGAALSFRVFRIEQNNEEDGNEFNLHGTQVGIFIRVVL